MFITYSGPHTGIAEATTAGKYLGQFFELLGFAVLGEWYVVGEFHGNAAASTSGRLGDIRGRPDAADLAEIRGRAASLARELGGVTASGATTRPSEGQRGPSVTPTSE